ncbi:Phospholipid-transporting ATPase 2 [Senna tora]|uniref:Phospholipid-transporting ATPase 2 n=1 Tax=Senna tora TaxID=362788 RepID=A0A834VWY9_9FABA|nr:Phospholipid-transporting ATPase 2 [Senna tora]
MQAEGMTLVFRSVSPSSAEDGEQQTWCLMHMSAFTLGDRGKKFSFRTSFLMPLLTTQTSFSFAFLSDSYLLAGNLRKLNAIQVQFPDRRIQTTLQQSFEVINNKSIDLCRVNADAEWSDVLPVIFSLGSGPTFSTLLALLKKMGGSDWVWSPPPTRNDGIRAFRVSPYDLKCNIGDRVQYAATSSKPYGHALT